MFAPTARMLMQPTLRRLAVAAGKAPKQAPGFFSLRSIPVEVYPLGGVVAFMVTFATYSTVRGFRDPNLRLSRSNHHIDWREV